MDDIAKTWAITPDAFDLLLTALNPERDAAAARYEQIRASLTRFFHFKGAFVPEDLADEVFNRVTRKFSEGHLLQLADHEGYFYQVARYVLSEYFRANKRIFLPLDELTLEAEPYLDPVAETEKLRERIEKEAGMDALRRCREALKRSERELLDAYETGRGREKIDRRNALCERFKKSKATLIVEVSRIRSKLKKCAVLRLVDLGVLPSM